MIRKLDVYLHGILAGILEQDHTGQITFLYDDHYLQFPSTIALSQSLPLRKEKFGVQECRGFFSGILPEGETRIVIARNLGISARNDFSMLEQIGGECAGAISFMPEGKSLINQKHHYRSISRDELIDIISELPKRPLLAGDHGIRLSLAGAQDKLAVHVEGETISIPLGQSPSTHILKPSIQRFAGMVHNESYCMNLAREIELRVAHVEVRNAGEIEYLLVKRYDRSGIKGDEKLVARLHQEDFCQALGIISEKKYEREGGPSLKECFNLLREISSAPLIDLQRLLDGIIFSFLIGNHDAHAKNFSIVYEFDETHSESIIRLAPLYDIVCTDFYPELDKHMAMAIGGKYVSAEISPAHFELFAVDLGFAKPLVRQRVIEMANMIYEKIRNTTTVHPVEATVASHIIKRVSGILKNFERHII